MALTLGSPTLAGVTAAAAGLIAAAPAVPPVPVSASPPVQLTSAVGDLLTPYADLIAHTVDNLKAIGADRLADPAPLLTQILSNQAGYADAIWSGLLTGNPGNPGDFVGAVADAGRGMAQNLLNVLQTATGLGIDLDLSHLLPPDIDALFPPIGELIAAILSGNFHDVIQDVIDQIGTADLHLGMPLALLLDAVGAPYFGVTSALDSGGDFFRELFGGQFGAAFTTAFTAPATVGDAFLNGSGVSVEQLLGLLGFGDLVGGLPPIDLGSFPVDIPLIGSGTAHLGEITVQGVSGTLPLGGLLAPLGHPDVGATVQYSGGQVVFDPICTIFGCFTPSPLDISSNPDVFDVSRVLGGTTIGGLLPALVNWVPQQLADAISAPDVDTPGGTDLVGPAAALAEAAAALPDPAIA